VGSQKVSDAYKRRQNTSGDALPHWKTMTTDEKQAHLERVAADLGEHFDCVQILAHDSDTDTYQTFESGSGSLYARMYQALRWSEHPQECELIEEDEDDES
jgi:hypothetical protein